MTIKVTKVWTKDRVESASIAGAKFQRNVFAVTIATVLGKMGIKQAS